MSQTAKAVALILASVGLSSVGQTLLKLGLDQSRAGETAGVLQFVQASFGSWQVWCGLVLFVGSVLVWMRVLATNDLSWSYPLLGLSYVMVALSGWLVFGEHLGVARIFGIALVLAGATFIASS